jgi:glyceraldehyde 3-phosphate dehydrogenase
MIFRAGFGNNEIDFVAINDLTDAETLAHLIKYDSVHGTLDAEVGHTEDALLINGKKIPVFAEKDPGRLPWRDLGVHTAMECTGLFRDKESASAHLKAGARKVIISAPGKEPDFTVVMGVNHTDYDPSSHDIISNASCTTNCLAPVCKVLMDEFGIEKGLMTTTHAYTGDQRLQDAPHKDLRRARAAAVSMIPTTTGAARAVSLVLPALKGKLNGMALRVPTPNVSVVDLVAQLTRPASPEAVNAALKKASEDELKGILVYSDKPLVSCDFNGSRASSVVDAPSTMVVGDMVKVLSWYDNEFGYSNRMVDLALYIASREG